MKRNYAALILLLPLLLVLPFTTFGLTIEEELKYGKEMYREIARAVPVNNDVYMSFYPRTVTDRLAVMYLGKLVEETDTARFFSGPLHPYSQALLSSVPRDHPKLKTARILLSGSLPSSSNPPPGCRFHTRCPIAVEKCRTMEPELIQVVEGHRVACHFAGGMA